MSCSRRSLIALAAGAGLAGAAALGSTAAGASIDAVEVERVLQAFSEALARGDIAELERLSAPGFILLEEGRFFAPREAFEAANMALRSATMIRTRQPLSTRVRGDVAWSHYRVRGRFQTEDAVLPILLLECAVLERTGGHWRLVQIATLQEAPQVTSSSARTG